MAANAFLRKVSICCQNKGNKFMYESRLTIPFNDKCESVRSRVFQLYAQKVFLSTRNRCPFNSWFPKCSHGKLFNWVLLRNCVRFFPFLFKLSFCVTLMSASSEQIWSDKKQFVLFFLHDEKIVIAFLFCDKVVDLALLNFRVPLLQSQFSLKYQFTNIVFYVFFMN